MAGLKERLFKGLDFKNLENREDFKEDSVREIVILPILKELGYGQENIQRSKNLLHPYLKVGSNRKKNNLNTRLSAKSRQ